MTDNADCVPCGRCQSRDRVNNSLGCPLCLACRTSFASLVVNAAADYPNDGSDDPNDGSVAQ